MVPDRVKKTYKSIISLWLLKNNFFFFSINVEFHVYKLFYINKIHFNFRRYNNQKEK